MNVANWKSLPGGPVRLAVRNKVSDWQQLLIAVQVRAWPRICIQDDLQLAVINHLSDTRTAAWQGLNPEKHIHEFR